MAHWRVLDDVLEPGIVLKLGMHLTSVNERGRLHVEAAPNEDFLTRCGMKWYRSRVAHKPTKLKNYGL